MFVTVGFWIVLVAVAVGFVCLCLLFVLVDLRLGLVVMLVWCICCYTVGLVCWCCAGDCLLVWWYCTVTFTVWCCGLVVSWFVMLVMALVSDLGCSGFAVGVWGLLVMVVCLLIVCFV